MSKAQGITKDNFDEFISSLNKSYEDKKVVHGTHTFYENGRWFGIIFYDGEKVNGNLTSPEKSPPKKPTKKQSDFLKTNRKGLIEQGFKVDDIKTSKEAWEVIGEFMKKNNLGKNEI